MNVTLFQNICITRGEDAVTTESVMSINIFFMYFVNANPHLFLK